MEKWTVEEKTQILNEEDSKRLEVLHKTIKRSIWRTNYHIQTVTGLMNDPNGFSYYNNQWHLFYQWFPFGAVHGMKHWYHVASSDLVHWKNEGLALKPDLPYDNFGCYSGSGFAKDKYLYLIYTGNSHNSYGKRVPYQLIAAMNQNNQFIKMEKPLIEPHPDYTEHQRDPKVFMANDRYYILLGAQNKENKGTMLLYESSQLAGSWKFKGELKIRGYENFGYMVECPCIEKIGNKWLLLFSPQGMPKEEERLQNAYANIYMIGDLDVENLEFIPDGPFEELDRGFDFYASQTANQSQLKDTAVLVGWFGCSDYTYPPTDEEGWAGLITLPRELTIEGGKLKQRPAANLDEIKGDLIFEAEDGEVKLSKLFGRTPESCIMSLENEKDESVKLNLFSTTKRKGFEISYDKNKKYLTIDRGEMIHQVNTDFGTIRKVKLEDGLKDMKIFVDHSTVEIFVNDGETVLSSRIFPTPEEHFIRMSGKDINLSIWRAEHTVKDDFVLFPEVKED